MNEKPKRPSGMRRRISLRPNQLYLMSVGIALLIAGALLTAFQYWALRDSLRRDLGVQAHMIADHAQAALLFQDSAAASEILSALRASESVAAATIFDKGGDVFATFERQARPDGTPSPSPAKLLANGMEVTHVIELEGATVGRVRIIGSLDQTHFRLAIFAAATLLTCALSMWLAQFLIAGMHRKVKKAEERLDYLAHFDPVTNLHNRHSFNERLDFAIERARRFGGHVALLLLDLDNFKTVNDTLGHQAGDNLLMNAAHRLTEKLRNADTVCRLGGDEFAVILENITDPHQAATVAQSLVENMAGPFDFDGKKLFVTASCGIGIFPEHARTPKDLIRNTDTAMYHAKEAGKNISAMFRSEMNEKADRRINLEGALRQAIENGTLELHYQPKIDFLEMRMTGVEALLRWNHADLGFISPAEFIPVAEDTGLIVPLGTWVLRTACMQAAKWDTQDHPPVNVSVNISAIQLKDPKFVEVVAGTLAASRLPADRLELELTESLLMEDVESNLGVLKRLRGTGVHLSIDDFGTGYSSMSYLKRFPIQTLKIDQSFVADLPGDKESAAITLAIIALARALSLETVAEGVENSDQAKFLVDADCRYLQGYLFSPALPSAKLWEWWEKSEFAPAKRQEARVSEGGRVNA